MSWDQAGQYSDNESLFRATLDKNPQCWMAHINLGVILLNQGKLDDAESHFQKALQIHPNDAEGHADLGNLYGQQGRIAAAIAQFREALKIHPNLPRPIATWESASCSKATSLRPSPSFAKPSR
jgi:protein O-mannosyl-transferase